MDTLRSLLSLFTASLLLLVVVVHCGTTPSSTTTTAYYYSSKLIHRFSDEAVSFLASKSRRINNDAQKLNSAAHFQLLLSGDLKRQRLKLGSPNQLVVPSQGSQTISYGNELGWLHYTWIDIGTPNVSFLVALDAGSDMLWVPCDCIQCAPLSSSHYYVLDRDLGEYNPSRSSTSKHLLCSHRLCEDGPNCRDPREQCPYSVRYLSDNTSSSGFLFEDQLHLAAVGGRANQSSVQASIVIGCGSKQSGDYLDGSAPDGLMGLGPGDISVPSLLAKSGLVPHSFSFCFDKSYSGRIFFGDQGPTTQRSTPFLPIDGKYITYFVEVEHYCFGSSCLKQTGFQALVDSGSSFTYLPHETYKRVVAQFDQQMDATRISVQDFPYCYEASSPGLPKFPSMKLVLSKNQSFLIENPMFQVTDNQGVDVFCLGILPTSEAIGIIGQNLMMGYRLVFDMENLKLGWSHSNCEDLSHNSTVHLPPPPSNFSVSPLPTDEQQRVPRGHAVAPAVAGRAPASSASPLIPSHRSIRILLLLQIPLLLPYLI